MLVRTIKTWWLVLAFVSGFGLAMLAEDLALRWHNNLIEFSAPHLHFLSGKPLERLHSGAQVPFDVKISLFSGRKDHLSSQLAERFLVSYSVWEEQFRVIKTQSPRKLVDHLDLADAEAWCLKQMPMEPVGIGDQDSLWARVEVRVPSDAKLSNPFGVGEAGINLNGLIELFSRPPATQYHWTTEAGPLTLEELKRPTRRGI
ncbi:MAG: hypothetical protein ABSF12_19560 [Bryobacteraceae bacterium]|jgi:hypothetical protein